MMNYQEIYNNNYKLIEQNYPAFATELNNVDLSEIEIIEDNGIVKNVKYKNDLLYPDEPYLISEVQVLEFLSNPQYFAKVPLGTAISKDIHDKFCKKILSKSPLKNKDKFTFNSFKTNSKNLPLLVLTGIGVGYEILHLIRNANIHHLIIAEKNLIFLKLSMHLFDWTEIFIYFKRDGYSLFFTFHDNESTLANNILASIARTNPMYSTFFYNFGHLRNEFFAKVLTEVKNNQDLVMKGWGFYDDEVISLKNTLSNISKNYPLFIKTPDEDSKNIPIFIIASGPSVDDDIEFIKRNKEKALIFSCGTAIKILFKNGIKPDFHLEIERPSSTYDALVQAVPKDYLKEIDLLALNVLDPKVLDLFKESYLYFRDIDTGSSILNKDIYKFMITNPTVTNAAVSLSLVFNFKDIYLFGADMGFISLDKHHSKDTIYNSKDSTFYTEKLKHHKKIKGNFVDEVYTTEIFFWTKFMIESSIDGLSKSNTKVTNCSNGALINGTIGVKSSELDFENYEILENKSEFIKLFFEKKDLESILVGKDINDIYNKFQKDIIFLIEVLDKFEHRIDAENYIIFIDLLYIYIQATSQTTKSIVGSSIKSFFYYMYSHSMASSDKKKNDKYIRNGFKVLKEYLEFINLDLEEILKEYLK